MSWSTRFRAREWLKGSLWVIPLIGGELVRLDAAVTRSFGDSVDLDRASTADAQGIGGRTPDRAVAG
jgi:hypothetical protein